ncbi:UbiX family flavin prenyltransferase [Candidatus Bathyarchaeota archaeon]|nr:UbiX family flavin prenyltransferase [Candidatus Bathyarchaeota archaeon]
MRLIIGISGASGTIYAIKLLEALKDINVEAHLIISKAAEEIIKFENELSKEALIKLASQFHEVNDLKALVTSGSYKTDGMIIVPCSMKTLAGIASGYASNLILRAADVTLKEKRPLVLVVRETPLNLIHLENMLKAAKAGAIILPASPAFYHKPKAIPDLVNYIVGKILGIFNLPYKFKVEWKGY